MKKSNIRVSSIVLAGLFALVGFAGVARAAFPPTPIQPDTMQAVSPQMMNAFNMIIGLLSGQNGGASANENAAHSNRTANAQGTIAQDDTSHKQTDPVRHVGVVLGMTPGQASTSELLIKTNQAEQDLEAAADDLANALTYALYQKYMNLSHKEAVALWLDEGIRAGIVHMDPELVDADPLKAFSLVSKAMAQSGGNNTIDGCGFVPIEKGQQLSLDGMQNDGTYSGKQSGAAKRHPQCRLWATEANIVAETPDNPECGNKIDCATGFVKLVNSMNKSSGAVYKEAKNLAYNAVTTSGGGSSDNSDHSSFFISSAYASPGSQTRDSNVPLTGAIGNLGSKENAFCQAAQQSKTDKAAGCGNTGSNQTTALWARNSHRCAMGTDAAHVGNNLSTSADDARGVQEGIRKGEDYCSQKWAME